MTLPVTEEFYERLPEAYRIEDAKQGDTLLNWVSSLTDQLDAVQVILERIDYTPLDEGGDPDDVSHLADSTLADTAWLPWLAQIVGFRLGMLTETEQRAVLSNPSAGYKPGTLASITAAVSNLLTGDKYVSILKRTTDVSATGAASMWNICIITKANETPDGVDIAAAVSAAGLKPAGHKLWHRVITTDWDAIESELPTWDHWAGKTWFEVEEAGM